jgi:hypothetical protein
MYAFGFVTPTANPSRSAPAGPRRDRAGHRLRERLAMPDRLHPQPDQVQRPGQLDRDERLRRALEERTEADGDAGGHHVVAAGVPHGGRDGRPPAVRQRSADHEQHPGSWHDDDEERRDRVAEQLAR